MKKSVPFTGGSVLCKDNDTVGIGPGRHVVHAPDVRGLGELLLVDENSFADKPSFLDSFHALKY